MKILLRKTAFSLWYLTCAISVVSCRTLEDIRELRRVDETAMIARAREVVVEAVPNLDAGAEKAIKQTRPELAYYLMGISGRWGQYLIRWNISSNRVVLVSGEGDFSSLPGAVVRISEISKAGNHYNASSENCLIFQSKPIP